MFVNNIMYNHNMENLKALLQSDTTTTKPKQIYSGGVLTKKFLTWNKQMIKQGKTYFYADPLSYYNFNTDRINKIPIDKRYKDFTPKKSFLQENSKFKGGYIPKKLSNKPTLDFKYKLDTDNKSSDWSKDNDVWNNNLMNVLINEYNISGNWRLIIKNNSNVNALIDQRFSIDTNFWKESKDLFRDGSEFMIWNSPNLNGEGDEIIFIFTKETKLNFSYYNQIFLDGPTNCLFTPMLEYFTKMVMEAKSKSTKMNYIAKINKIIGKETKDKRTKKIIPYLEQFKHGTPQSELPNICEALQIGIDIEQPFLEKKLFEYRSTKKPLKVFKFINTRLNHIEQSNQNKSLTHDKIFKSFDKEPKTKHELKEIKESCKKNKELCIYNKNPYGDIIQVRTLTNNYNLEDVYYKIVQEFEQDTKLNLCNYDFINNEELHNFIINGTHFNGTIDFTDTEQYKEQIPTDIKHIDMTKAYTQFKTCSFYSGFMGKITDFRKVDNYEQKGLYYITNLDLSNCHSKFLLLNDSLKWFYDNNIYTDAELTALSKFGGKFDVKYGAMGMKLDFEFNEDMINKTCDYDLIKKDGTIKTIKLPYYCKWTGMNVMSNKNKNFYMEGDENYFKNFDIKNDEESSIWLDGSKEARISYKKKYGYNKAHITAQITAYQRLIMLEQLLNMNTHKLVRICVDGIYYKEHECKILDSFSYKSKMTFNNSPCDEYLSNLNLNKKTNEIEYLPTADNRKFVKSELYDGAGGVGKTFHNLMNEKGFVNFIYIAHSWKLARNKQIEYEKYFDIEKFISLDKRKYYNKKRLPISVHSYLFNKYATDTDILNRYSVILIDECSMLTESKKKYILDNAIGKVIFMGDIDAQLKPVVNENEKMVKKFTKQELIEFKTQMTREGIDLITTLTKNYRFKCDELKEVAQRIRNNIGNKQFSYKMLLDKCNTISLEQLKSKYDKEDIILCYNRDNKYNKIFKDINKFKITNNTRDYKNGEVVFDIIDNKEIKKELRHGYTIHSIQGETYEKNIYIDLSGSWDFDNRLLYTAVSRARYLSQIYFIV